MTHRNLFEAAFMVGVFFVVFGAESVFLVPGAGGLASCGILVATGVVSALDAVRRLRAKADDLDERVNRGAPPVLVALCLSLVAAVSAVVGWEDLRVTSFGGVVLACLVLVAIASVVAAVRWSR